jgi:4-hydroxybenzoate polyprenyltransferase
VIPREFYLSWRFIGNDIWAGLLPGLAFTIVALRQHAVTTQEVCHALLRSSLYFWLFLYGHTLANHRINKPFRPLPSGLVSVRGARRRLIAVSGALLLVGLWLGIFPWALLWVATYLLLNFYGHRHWFLKNSLPMSVGALAMLGAAWELVLPLTTLGWQTALTIAGFVALTSPIQDFRDVAGDRTMGRKTLPISIGEWPARGIISAMLLLWLPVAYFLLMRHGLSRLTGGLVSAAIMGLELVVAIRLLRLSGSAADHRTYRLYEQLYCLYVVSGLVYLA